MEKLDKKTYIVLEKLGLTKDEINKEYEVNEYINLVLAKDIEDVINYLKNYGLKEKEIAQITKKNPWIVTESFERIKYLEKYYSEVGITDYAQLLKIYPIAMSINPIKVKNLINEMLEKGKTKEEIKNIILEDYEKYLSLK